MKKGLLILLLAMSCVPLVVAQNILKGRVSSLETGESIIGAAVLVKGRLTGTVTDLDGNFEMSTAVPYPVTLEVSFMGYQRTAVEIPDANPVEIRLAAATELLDEVVFSASRIEETIFQSPVTIDKMDLKTIRQGASLSFYDGIQNLKGVDLMTSGLTYKQINTRGFNSIGNSRFLQLVDGVDNQTPGLNFSVGNLFGSSDLDMESVELIPGAA